MSTTAKNYGSAQQAEEGTADQYDLDNTYYVKERPMSTKERCGKIMLVLLPIVLALLLVGGFTYYVISNVLQKGGGRGHDTVTTFPSSPKGGSSGQETRPGTYPTEHSPPAPAPAPKEKSHASSGSSACSSNLKCADLGLVGECCPTKQGVTLGCCD